MILQLHWTHIEYSAEKTSQQACDKYFSQVKYNLNKENYIDKYSIDLQNTINSSMEWIPATENTKKL